jgi:hypothetical protein
VWAGAVFNYILVQEQHRSYLAEALCHAAALHSPDTEHMLHNMSRLRCAGYAFAVDHCVCVLQISIE